ncbi:uncharacterized protein B0H18DRAFT_408087 [Fomitopsis serialis]|uniref:uncharacterized protein n=1 Tax=Fomitopsis serialis TaxID=139415 RepID=UPI0020072567|nr:uncharacterized protein B0H18DRAFT_408087 [Neoantrodia serialis]KAH9935274.1 hypothetical protein B0H18DRAFT_408087 [Neoantrodia serialis]
MFCLYPFSAAFVLTFLAGPVLGGGNTTCAGSALDWYTDTVGETPCMTYQRLRQICNSDYEVPSFRPNTPGDNCDDQLSACCCNSIAWALSMLCMNCQWDVDGGSANGIDAGVPAYYWYRFSDSNGQYCGDGTNQTLPSNIEQAVCNQGIKLENFLYRLFWNTGAWFYTYTRETGEQDHAADGTNIYHCASSTTSSTPSKSSAPTSSSIGTIIQPTTAPTQTQSAPVPGSSSPAASTASAESSSSSASSESTRLSSSSFVTTLESRTTVDGTATSVPYITTVVTTVPSSTANGTAVGLGAAGSGKKTSTGAIVGGVVGGVAGLLLLGVLVGCLARRKRSGAGAPVIITDTAATSPSSGPMSPNMVERNFATPFLAPASTSDPFANPAPMGKWAQMQLNASGYTAPSSTSHSGSSSSTTSVSGPGFSSREALHPVRAPTESASSYSQVDVAPHAGLSDVMGPVVQEEDAGRLTGGGLRLPPAYQSEWNAE